MANRDLEPIVIVVLGLCLSYGVGCSRSGQPLDLDAMSNTIKPVAKVQQSLKNFRFSS
jgi:hypothetical protein